MNQRGRDDAKQRVFRLIAAVPLLLGEITIRTGRIASLPRGGSTTSSYLIDPGDLDQRWKNTEMLWKFYLRFFSPFFFIGRNVFIARTRSSRRLAFFFFLNGFDGSACFTSYIEQICQELTYQCSVQYVAGSIDRYECLNKVKRRYCGDTCVKSNVKRTSVTRSIYKLQVARILAK